MSAKLKLTLWNSLLMVVLTAMILGIILTFSDDMIHSASQQTLIDMVMENGDELEFDDGKLDLDDVTLYESGVYTLLYSTQGDYLAGSYPVGFEGDPAFENQTVTEYTVGNQTYYIYDYLSSVEDSPAQVWVRGVMAVDDLSSQYNVILKMALIALPLFVLLATGGCYLIAKQAFRPLEKIIATADHIRHNQDLSQRIALKKGSQEVRDLASAFDQLFAHLEDSFIAEQQFSQNVSHELRTPTAVILAQCEFALDQSATLADKEEALVVVQRQAGKMSKLVGDLLQLMRLERGLEQGAFDTVDLSELVEIVWEEQASIAPQGVALVPHIQGDLQVQGNQTMLIRLVSNLVSNAYRYGASGGEIIVTLAQQGSEIVLSVQDKGVGIAPEHLTRIWDRFYQVDSARTADKSQSMGLGLSMVAEIAKSHQAQVAVTSEVGQGSCFTVTFPKTF